MNGKDLLFIDMHNHLELLPAVTTKLTNWLYAPKNSVSFLTIELNAQNKKAIISVSLYATPGFGKEEKQIENQISILEKLCKTNNELLLIKNKEDLYKDFTLGFILHIESARWMKDFSLLEKFYERGVRSIIPVHFKNNWFGGSCDDPAGRLHKTFQTCLTDKGQAFLSKMHELGMWMDISHMNTATFEQATHFFQGPVLASHTAARALVPIPRNNSDEEMKTIGKKRGLIGLTAWTHMLGKTKREFYRQIDHILSLELENAICIGSDLGPPISTIKKPYSLFHFHQDLYEHYPKEIADKIAYKNAWEFLERSL